MQQHTEKFISRSSINDVTRCRIIVKLLKFWRHLWTIPCLCKRYLRENMSNRQLKLWLLLLLNSTSKIILGFELICLNEILFVLNLRTLRCHKFQKIIVCCLFVVIVIKWKYVNICVHSLKGHSNNTWHYFLPFSDLPPPLCDISFSQITAF